MIIDTTTQEIREEVIKLINLRNVTGLSEAMEALPFKEIVHLIEHLDRDDRTRLFTILSPVEAAEIMEEIPEVQAVKIIEKLETDEAAAILNEMESDDKTDLLMELDDENAQAILDKMEPTEAASVRKLLNYEHDTAGGMMHTEYFSYYDYYTIRHVTEDLRQNSDKYQQYHVKYIFVTDLDNTLKGVLQMQDLLLGQMDDSLSDIIIENVSYVDHLATLDDLIDFFHKHDWIGVPVLDSTQKLIGVVLQKDILEAQTERITQEHLESQGIIGGDELRTMPILLRAKRRLSWLSVNILLNIAAASVIAYNQDVLSSVIAMAVFLPIISDMSGCSGNQAVAVSMRELSIGAVTPTEVWRVLWQELSVGLINGVVLGILIGVAAFLWKGNLYLGLVVGSALTINTLFAVSIGGTVPLILKGLNIDPALASGPLLTTITDMLGFFLALSFAAMAMGHLQGL